MIRLSRLLGLILSGLIAGNLCGIWIAYDAAQLSAAAYVEQQQGMIRAFNVLMPLTGAATIFLTLLAAILQRRQLVVRRVLLAAALLLIVTGLITRLGCQPINAIVMTWDKTAPPADWRMFRDKWQHLHQLRTLASLGAFFLIAALATVLRDQYDHSTTK